MAARIAYFQLSKRKATASSYAPIVFDSRAADYRPEFIDWARGDCCSFLNTGIATSRLATRLCLTYQHDFIL